MYTLPFYQLTLVSCLYLPADESYYKKKVNFGRAIPFLQIGVKWKVVKDVHWPLLLMDTSLMSLSSC